MKLKYYLNFGLIFLILILLPLNYSSQPKFDQLQPLVRPVFFQFSPISDYPVNFDHSNPPYLSARSAVVFDLNSKAFIYSKNPDLKLLPASLTKIMTAIIVLENYDLNQVIVVEPPLPIGQTIGLKVNEKLTVESLLYGLMVKSGNDAAVVLARNFPSGGLNSFIKAMNQKAEVLNLTNTQFTNPTGLDDFGHYTTARDLVILAAYAMDNPVFRRLVSTIGITITDIDQTQTHELENINELLGKIAGMSGIKTGWTELAGECLVTYTKRDNHSIITVVLGSDDRFGETTRLIDWVFAHHQWQSPSPTIH